MSWKMNFMDFCRFCVKEVDNNKRIQIKAELKQKYNELTNTELTDSEFYSDFSCTDCVEKLVSCVAIKNEFLNKQRLLENLCNRTFIQTRGEESQESFVPKIEEILGNYNETSSNQNFLEPDDLKEIILHNFVDVKLEVEPEIETLDQLVFNESCIDPPDKKDDSMFLDAMRMKSSPLPDQSNEEKIVPNLRLHNQKFHKKDIPKCKIIKREPNKALEKIPCIICGKMLCNSAIQLHIQKVHLRKVRYHCDVCGRGYYEKTAIAKHLKKHFSYFDTDPVQCYVCHRFYKTPKTLKLHLKDRHTDKKFVCNFENNEFIICGKQYRTHFKLKEHYDICHRGIRKYKCEDCDSCYNNIRDLENHQNIVHLHKKIKCELCPVLLTRKEYYKRHINLFHKELDEIEKSNILDRISKTHRQKLFNVQVTPNNRGTLPKTFQ